MKLVTIAAFASLALAGPGCEKRTTPAPDPEFSAEWNALARKGLAPFYVEQDRGQGLMGSVHRAAALGPEADKPVEPAPTAIPTVLADQDVMRVIKVGLTAVKHCYLAEEHSGNTASGKAIVTFKIQPTGSVQEVRVEAPAFQGSKLPACLSGRIRGWQFPKFSGEPMTVSYPFVFMGG